MAEQSYGDWITSNPELPTKEYKKEHMAQMTAAEWLIEQIKNNHNICYRNITKQQIEQAKQMEKEQIMDAYDNVALDDNGNFMTGEQYYNDTYTQSGTEQD